MSVCVIITAAGCSTRMGTFKPVLPLGGQPAVRRLLYTYFSAGVSHAVLVTGFREDLLRRVCADIPNLTFVHNPDYRSTQMFDSIQIGLSAVPQDSTRLLLTPADIPLVQKSTITALLMQSGPLVFPSYRHHRGHPLLIDRKLSDSLLRYDGTDGLRGALHALSAAPSYINVDDPYILKDMDTPDDYAALAAACEVK